MDREEILSDIKKIELVIRRRIKGGTSGLYRSVYRGTGIELEGLREYSEDDDFRLIDWNASARTGKPYTRVMQEERGLELYLLVDVSASMTKGGRISGPARKTKLEAAAVAAAVLGFSASSSRDKTAAVFFSGRVEETILPAAGRGHVFRIAEKILDIMPRSSGSNLKSACASLPGSFRKKGICAIISDMNYDIPWISILKLSSRAQLLIFRIYDPDEKSRNNSYSFDAADMDPEGMDPEGVDPEGAGTDLADSAHSGRSFFKIHAGKSSGSDSGNLMTDMTGTDALRKGIFFADISTDDNIAEKINSFFKMLKR
jgi:uncharacterized protein (DUF58 family)